MQILTTRAQLLAARKQWGQVGFIPTMGALHAGHISLVELALADGLLPVVSVFVNPIQFTKAADFNTYPIETDSDIAMLEAAGCHAVFMPSAAEMYAHSISTTLHFGDLDHVLEGASRPGHFSGVGLVVANLLHLIAPLRAYFGQKDLQQLAVVRRLVQDLGFTTEIVPGPTVRQADGLAMSSRNQRLSPEARAHAPQLYAALSLAFKQAQSHGIAQGIAAGRAQLALVPAFTVDYFEAVHPITFQLLSAESAPATGPFAIATAACLGGVRLLDNVVVWQ